MSQLSLFNEKVDNDNLLVPITLEITFEISDNGLTWDGKAYPHVSSGCWFGGSIPSVENPKERIEKIIENEVEWFRASYKRVVKKKITIIDKRKKKIKKIQ
ncbi:MAG TPA: hypothetical protein ENI51_06535 [Candidatus Atribacteria bacterium]|nr:hypothetical protein [Candidatus Atribacteria bacterium]